MSENNFLHTAWTAMSTEALDEKLQQELRKENPEEEVVLGILRILQEREADHPIAIDQTVSDAWDAFKQKISPRKKRNPRPFWVISAVAAAVICIVLMAIPQTVGAESVFDVFFRWTASVFEFFIPGQEKPKPSTEYVFQTDHPGLQQVYDAVTAQGATEPVVPMWIPEGFELKEMKSMKVPRGDKIRAVLRQGDSSIMLSYWVSAEIVASQYEKEDILVEFYECAGVYHFIMDNDDSIAVTWTVDGVECSLTTDLERETVYQIIKSIYRRQLS